ncbi:hypothetical protein HanRHA438_Chr08g0331761 [Helianthus annuus]|nr:hypothetical protein HanRHA438_Chr08g0331761 [Helianthus annuus]
MFYTSNKNPKNSRALKFHSLLQPLQDSRSFHFKIIRWNFQLVSITVYLFVCAIQHTGEAGGEVIMEKLLVMFFQPPSRRSTNSSQKSGDLKGSSLTKFASSTYVKSSKGSIFISVASLCLVVGP